MSYYIHGNVVKVYLNNLNVFWDKIQKMSDIEPF